MIFNLICGLTSDWDQPIEDIKVTTLARDFLQVLKEKVHLLPSVSRYLMPEDYLVFGIDAFSDGSEWLSTFVMYLLSCLPSGERTSDTNSSRNCGALCKTKHHSVPCNEACGCVMAVEAICSYVINHHDALFATHSPRTFPINLGIDSECLLWSLNPVKLHTSVLIKNVARKVHALSRDLTQRYPKITMNYYFIEGSRNPADLNSKIPPSLDPIEIVLSKIWQEGLPEQLQGNWPPPNRIFLKVVEGELIWLAKTKEPSNCIKCNNSICGDQLKPH